MKRRIRRVTAVVLALGLFAVLMAGWLVRSSAKGRTYSDVARIPHRRVGVILGCSRVLSDGRANLFFAHRIAAAVELFRAGKIDYLIVSGDNHVAGYDESTDMKRALVIAGIPEERVYCDFAGFRTLDSMARAKVVFGQSEVTVISQEFHNQRAIYIASHKGLDAIGFNAREVDARNGFRTKVREQLARVKTVLDVTVLRTRPRFFGPRIEVGSRQGGLARYGQGDA